MRDAHCAPVRASRARARTSEETAAPVFSRQKARNLFLVPRGSAARVSVVPPRRPLPRPVHTKCPFSGTSDTERTPVGFNGPSVDGGVVRAPRSCFFFNLFLSSHSRSLEYTSECWRRLEESRLSLSTRFRWREREKAEILHSVSLFLQNCRMHCLWKWQVAFSFFLRGPISGGLGSPPSARDVNTNFGMPKCTRRIRLLVFPTNPIETVSFRIDFSKFWEQKHYALCTLRPTDADTFFGVTWYFSPKPIRK